MVLHDLECGRCGTILIDQAVESAGPLPACPNGDGVLEIVFLPSHIRSAACHSSETAVVYYSAAEGKYQYPARNDIPIPDRLRSRGYERVELRSLKDIERFEKKNNVVNERAWFDRGSGRGFEDGHR